MRELIVPILGEDDARWTNGAQLEIDQFPWYSDGLRQKTDVQIYRTAEAIHIRAVAQDRWSGAVERELHSSVHLDSCFEFFVTPKPERGAPYLNFEFNCIGSMFVGFGPDVEHRTTCTPEQAAQIGITTSLQGTKIPTPEDDEWSIELKIPLTLIEELVGYKTDENRWYVNFFRCGGPVEPQYACWNRIEWPHPAFHRPEQFGALEFLRR